MSVDQKVVADYVHDVSDRRGKHRGANPVHTAQGRAERKSHRLKERKRTCYLQICHAVCHQLVAKPHHPQDQLGVEVQQRARAQAQQRIEGQRRSDNLDKPLPQPRPVVLRADDRHARRRETVHKDRQHDDLACETDRRHSAVAAARQHEHVDEPHKHDKGDLHENGDCKSQQLPSQGVHPFIL